MESQITVRLPVELAERLARVAAERRLSRSQVVRRAIRAFLERPPATDVDRPFDRVRDLEGAAYGGPPDLGARHRDYLTKLLRGG